MRLSRLLSLILVFAAVLSACRPASGAPSLLLTPTASGEVTPVLQGEGIVATAVVVPARQARLSFPIGGVVGEVLVEEGERVQAGQVLATLDVPELEYAVAQAEAALRAAESEYSYWRYPRNKPPERRELAQEEVHKAEAALAVAQAEFAQSLITAPFDGTIVAVEIEPGAVVQPAEVVLVLADLEHLHLETTDLSERQIAGVSPGDEAVVTIESLGVTVGGHVTSIAPRAETLGGDVVFKVMIEPDEQIEGLRWGMRAEVEIKGSG